jgi:integrase
VPETCQPCFNLPKLPKEHERERVLDANEIRIFWRGLDRDDLPWDRKTRLALKFELVTMLRSGEAHRGELFDLDGSKPCFRVPAKRVKKRRVIEQPLSDLAVEIIRQAMAGDDQQFVFESPVYPGQPIHRTAMATALRGTKHEKNRPRRNSRGRQDPDCKHSFTLNSGTPKRAIAVACQALEDHVAAGWGPTEMSDGCGRLALRACKENSPRPGGSCRPAG